MVTKYKKCMIVVIALVMSITITIQACLITFINDQYSKVLIYDSNDGAIIPIGKNERRRFGSQDQHTSFVIYVQQPSMGFFTPLYTCQQNGCDSNDAIQLRLSDIEKGADSLEFFTITKHKPYVPMVQKLPMMQKG